MNSVIIQTASVAASTISEALSSVSRIVEFNNWRDVELFKIRKATEVSCNRIRGNARVDKAVIDFCYEQASAALKSKKLTSAQKREIFTTMVNKMLNT